MAPATRLWLGLLGLFALFLSPVASQDVYAYPGRQPGEPASICYTFVSTWLTVPGSGPTPMPLPPSPSPTSPSPPLSSLPLSNSPLPNSLLPNPPLPSSNPLLPTLATTSSSASASPTAAAAFAIGKGGAFYLSLIPLLDDPSGQIIAITTTPAVDWVILNPVDKSISGIVPANFALGDVTVTLRVRYTRTSKRDGSTYEVELKVSITVQVPDLAIPPVPTLVAGQPYNIPLARYLKAPADNTLSVISSQAFTWITLSQTVANVLQGLVPRDTRPGVIAITITVQTPITLGLTYTATFAAVIAGPSDVFPPISLSPGQTFNIGLLPNFRHTQDFSTAVDTFPLSSWVQLDRNANFLRGTVPLDQPSGPVVVTVTVQSSLSANTYTITTTLQINAGSSSIPAGSAPPVSSAAAIETSTVDFIPTSSPAPVLTLVRGQPFDIPVDAFLRGPQDLVNSISTNPSAVWLTLAGLVRPQSLQGTVPLTQAAGTITLRLAARTPDAIQYEVTLQVVVVADLPPLTTTSAAPVPVNPTSSPLPVQVVYPGEQYSVDLEPYLQNPIDTVGAVTALPLSPWIVIGGARLLAGIVPDNQPLGLIIVTVTVSRPGGSYPITLNILVTSRSSSSIGIPTGLPTGIPSGTPTSGASPSPTSSILTLATITPGEPFSVPLDAFLTGPNDSISTTIATDPLSLWIQVSGRSLAGTVPAAQLAGSITVTFQVVRQYGTLSSGINVRLVVVAALPISTTPLIPTGVSTTGAASQTPGVEVSLPPFPVYPGQPFNIPLVDLLKFPTDFIVAIFSTDPVSPWVGFLPGALLGNVPPGQPTGLVLVVLQVQNNIGTLYKFAIQLLVQPLGQSTSSISAPSSEISTSGVPTSAAATSPLPTSDAATTTTSNLDSSSAEATLASSSESEASTGSPTSEIETSTTSSIGLSSTEEATPTSSAENKTSTTGSPTSEVETSATSGIDSSSTEEATTTPSTSESKSITVTSSEMSSTDKATTTYLTSESESITVTSSEMSSTDKATTTYLTSESESITITSSETSSTEEATTTSLTSDIESTTMTSSEMSSTEEPAASSTFEPTSSEESTSSEATSSSEGPTSTTSEQSSSETTASEEPTSSSTFEPTSSEESTSSEATSSSEGPTSTTSEQSSSETTASEEPTSSSTLEPTSSEEATTTSLTSESESTTATGSETSSTDETLTTSSMSDSDEATTSPTSIETTSSSISDSVVESTTTASTITSAASMTGLPTTTSFYSYSSGGPPSLVSTAPSGLPTVPCAAVGYGVAGTAFLNVDLLTGVTQVLNPGPYGVYSLDAIGYNPRDNYIYGLAQPGVFTGDLVRIGANGIAQTVVKNMVSSSLNNQGTTFTVGTIDEAGIYWAATNLVGGTAQRWFSVDLIPGSATYGQVKSQDVASLPMVIYDWVAVAGDTQYLYALGTEDRSASGPPSTGTALLRFSRSTGLWTTVRSYGHVVGTDTWGSLYTSSTGAIYGIENTSGQIRQFSVGSITVLTTSTQTDFPFSLVDGTRCPSQGAP